MNSDFFTDLAVEASVRENFNRRIDITKMIVRDIQVGPASHASIFKIKGGGVYALIRSASEMTLGDVMKMARKMGIEAEECIPPAGVASYFDDKAIEKFKQVFPGKHITNNSEDLRYYRTLVPYTPALLSVARIGGELLEFKPQTREWQVIKRLSYAKIDTK
ncbi:MAG TPA: hypothetical protein VFZ58_01505 [Candidatus Saccharimonadales bacterium]